MDLKALVWRSIPKCRMYSLIICGIVIRRAAEKF